MKKITSIKSYIDIIMDLRAESLKLELPFYQWFFRGQKNQLWPVEPNVFRNDGLSKESVTIQSALRQNPFEFKDSSGDFEILTKLQHYGLGTRLLDVTLNPLVALYFATESCIEYNENKNGQFTQVERDGAIYAKFAHWNTTNELCVRIASSLPFINFTEDYTINSFLAELKNNNVISEYERDMLKKDNCNLLIQYIQDNYFVLSSHSNERLIRQSGAFVLPTALIVRNSGDIENSIIVKSHQNMNSVFDDDILIVPSNKKNQIREELDFFNINEATMYPELEHQMVYVKEKNIPTSGSVPLFERYSNIQPVPEKDFNNLEPDAIKVVENMPITISEDTKRQLIQVINEKISMVDWKQKEVVRSQITSAAKKIFQSSFSAVESKQLSQKLLALLLNPTDELSK